MQHDAGQKTSGLLEQQAVHGADTKDRRPRKQGMVHGKESRGAKHSAPSAPIAVKGAIEQPAKQVLFSKWSEADGHDGVSNAQAREPGGGLLGIAKQFRERRDVTENNGVSLS